MLIFMNEYIGESKESRDLQRNIPHFFNTGLPLLIYGPSGVGKNYLVQLISSYGSEKWIEINCKYFPSAENLAARILQSDQAGIILDNIDAVLSISSQGIQNLLEKWITGGKKLICLGSGSFPVDSENRTFSKFIQIQISPLSERKEDILPLFRHFSLGIKVADIQEILDFLYHYPFPGNVAELKDISGLVAEGGVDYKNMLLLKIRAMEDQKQNSKIIPGLPMSDYECMVISENLKFFGNNRKKTADSLKISERNLYRILRKYGL